MTVNFLQESSRLLIVTYLGKLERDSVGTVVSLTKDVVGVDDYVRESFASFSTLFKSIDNKVSVE